MLLCALAMLPVGCGNDLGYGNEQTVAASGLPCDVQTFLADHCQGCHGSTPSSGATISLMTYADLMATGAGGATIAQRALARMTSPTSQMPPLPAAAVAPTDIAVLQNWVNAGAPMGDCAPGPFDGPPVCTSGKTWRGEESPLMEPGAACIACHTRSREAPRFAIAGTVYPTGHEPTECFGATSGAIEVSDASGRVTTLSVNAAGNFFSSSSIAFPIHVAVVAGGNRRAMTAAPPTGDCNSCHTADGANGAPGRIALP